MSPQKKSLGYVSLALLNISAIISLRHLPVMAQYGVGSLFFYCIAALIFLIPIALICAELATTWPDRGGLYNWIYQGFGPRIAFLVVWWSWMAAIVTILLNLIFLSVTLAYTIAPASLDNKAMINAISLIILYGLTLINIYGMRFSSLISLIGVIAGTIIPVLLITILAAIWFFSGYGEIHAVTKLDLSFVFNSFSSLFFFAAVVLGFSGIELAAFHVADAKDPQRDYSKAIFLSVVLIILLYMISTLAIALVLPLKEIDLIAGLVQFFNKFFEKFGLQYISKLVSFTVVIGTIGGINTWLISPSKGIFPAVEHFNFPSWLSYKNKYDVPVSLLVIQAIICTIILLLLSNSQTIQQSFWMFTASTTQFVILIYLFMIAAVVRLRFLQPNTIRPFRIPDKWFSLTTRTAFFSCILVLFVSFIPAEKIQGSLFAYELFFTLGLILMSLPPFFFKKKQEKNREFVVTEIKKY
jgi:amino acid transporter